MCTRKHQEAWWCSKILQIDDNLLVENDAGTFFINQNLVIYIVLDGNLEGVQSIIRIKVL